MSPRTTSSGAARCRLRHDGPRRGAHARGGGITAATIAGQLAAAVAVDHFGLLGVHRSPVDATRLAGLALLAAGVVLVVRS